MLYKILSTLNDHLENDFVLSSFSLSSSSSLTGGCGFWIKGKEKGVCLMSTLSSFSPVLMGGGVCEGSSFISSSISSSSSSLRLSRLPSTSGLTVPWSGASVWGFSHSEVFNSV